MTFHGIQDERDFYEKALNHLREQTKLQFSIEIQGVSDEDQPQIKDALQALLSTEVINLEQEKLRARGVSGEFLTVGDLRPTLEQLPLPEKERTRLEAKVRQAARQFVSPQAGGGPEAGTERSVEPVQFSHAWQSRDTHASVRGVLVRAAFPGTHNAVTNINPLPPFPPGYDPSVTYLVFDIFLKGLPSENYLVLRVDPYSTSREEMAVGLASEVQWHREIRIWDLCRGQVSALKMPSPGSSSWPRNHLALRKSIACGPQTLVFSDGFWNFAHFDNVQFWQVFGGKKLSFFWVEGLAKIPSWLTSDRIIQSVHSDKYLDVSNWSTANGARIHQWGYLGGTNQQWYLQWLGGYGRDAYYRIVAKHSGKVLDVVDKSTANGAEIQQWDWLNGHNQIWRFEELGGGYNKIVSSYSGKVLTVSNKSYSDGARIQQWEWLGVNNEHQKWTLWVPPW